MKKYYRLSLNCGRRKNFGSRFNEYGYIEVFPQPDIEQKKGVFGVKYTPITTYTGRYDVIAELVDDHFEDIVLNKRIEYNKDGVKDIKYATIDELIAELDNGLTCYYYREIDPSVAEYYIERIKEDENVLSKYISELTEIEKKINVLNEIKRRVERTPFEEQIIEEKPKRRIRNIRSA